MTHFISIFAQYADSTNLAIRTKSETLSYRELNERVNQYANYLLQQKMSSEKAPRIAIVYHRSADMFVWMLAIWKINASFMLIDSSDLQQTGLVQGKLERIDPQFVITSKDLRQHAEVKNHSLILTDDVQVKNKIAELPKQFTFQLPKDNTEAYIIATSGTSTGVPKLVIVNHTLAPKTGLTAVFQSCARLFQLTPDDSYLINGAVNWDPNIFNFGVALSAGASVYIASPDEVYHLRQLLSDCEKYNVNVILAVPSAALLFEQPVEKSLLKKIQNLRLIFTGESLDDKIVDKFLDVASGGIFNGYGPSEGPIGITATRVVDSNHISIGDAMDGREYKVINSDRDEVEPGEEGEIVWKAEGFGGYLDDKAETEKKIVILKNGERYYHTGDLAVKIGNDLIYRGRIDKQFKVMGIFFNPEDVGGLISDLVTRSHTVGVKMPHAISEVPVVFYKSESNVDEEELRTRILAKYRVIIKFMRLKNDEEFPLTKNNKTDERALANKYIDYVERNTPTAATKEQALQQIWCSKLDIKEIQTDKTFYQHKPDSILFAEFISAIWNHPMLRNEVDIDEIRNHYKNDKLTFNKLVELATQVNRANYVTYLYQEKIDYPVIIIDGNQTERYEEIAPNSPIIIVRPTNDNETPENKFKDALKTIKRIRLEAPYFVVQVFRDELNEDPVFGWGHWEKLKPECFHFLKRFWNILDVQGKLVPEMEKKIRDDIRNKLGDSLKSIETDPPQQVPVLSSGISLNQWKQQILESGFIPLILDDQSNIEKQFILKGIYRKHLTRFNNLNIAIAVTVTPHRNMPDANFLWQLSNLGLETTSVKFLNLSLKGRFFSDSKEPFFPAGRSGILPNRLFDGIATFYHSERNENPLFLFAPFTGEDVYQKFCEQLNVPCIVLRHPLLAEKEIFPEASLQSLKDLAYFYTIVINQYQPHGAINLAGWSFGGLMAIIVAQQFNYNTRHVDKREVSYVGIIDTTAPDYLSPNVLMERILWILKTYNIPHEENDIKILHSLKEDQIWEWLHNSIKKVASLKTQEYLSKIIRICRQHYQFGFQQVSMLNQENFHLYCADGKTEPSQIIPFFKYTKPADDKAKSNGWTLPYSLIRGTNHFTILESEGLRKSMIRDCKLSRSSRVNVLETLKEIILSQIPNLLKPTENRQLLDLIENQSTEEKTIILQETENEKLLSGLQLLMGFWRAYQSEPAKKALPIYLDLKEHSKYFLESLFEKLKLSPTQPHCINEMKIIFIIDHVDESMYLGDLLDSIECSRIDISHHPIIWLCDKKYYQEEKLLEKILKLEDLSKYQYLQQGYYY